MSNEEAIREAAREAGLDAAVTYREVTESTNTTAMRLAADGADEWTLVVAGHQTGGRGRLGRTWMSEPGGSLLFSLVLRPDLAPADAGLITLLGGVAMAEAARVSCNASVTCKWPNDLMVEGGKAGGILAESSLVGDRLAHVVLGAGVNVGSAPDVEGAASLGGGDPAVLLSAFLWCFKQRYKPGDAGFARDVVEAHRAVSATLGRQVSAEISDGGSITGL
ncbi:MAG: biotin--[acetyl-CoA-carboxylase] ligase, partial [Actinobacteria bacterium]|nr:biotin--[acetyl-CoA-carboxylase] ligase [Actinomycetota bacterium]